MALIKPKRKVITNVVVKENLPQITEKSNYKEQLCYFLAVQLTLGNVTRCCANYCVNKIKVQVQSENHCGEIIVTELYFNNKQIFEKYFDIIK